jgi:hypothetical protein
MSNLYQVKEDIIKGFLRFKSKHIDYDVTHNNGQDSFIVNFRRVDEVIFSLEFNLKNNPDCTPLESNNIFVSFHGKTNNYSFRPNKDNIKWVPVIIQWVSNIYST